jgi:hypothetical protein
MLTEDDIKSYTAVYFDYSIQAKNDLQKYEWPSLVKFLIQWRRDDVSKEDPLFEYWISNIAPSCVYQKNTTNVEEFVCVFCETKGFKRAPYLIRHYKELHYDLMPAKVFVENIIYKCILCNIDFARKEYLTMHESSEKHRKMIDPQAVVVRKRNSKNDEVKKESEAWFKKAKPTTDLKVIEEDNESLSSDNFEEDTIEEKKHFLNKNYSSPVKQKLIKIGLEDENSCAKNDSVFAKKIGEIITEKESLLEAVSPDEETIKTQPLNYVEKDDEGEGNKENTLNDETVIVPNNLERSPSIQNNSSEMTVKSEKKLLKALSIQLENDLKF